MTCAGPDGRAATPTTPWAEVSVCVSRRGPRPVISVSGALDTSGAALLTAMLDHVRQVEGWTAEVDLARVEYADSHGLAPLLDGQATIRRASPVVERLLALVGVPGTDVTDGLHDVPTPSGRRHDRPRQLLPRSGRGRPMTHEDWRTPCSRCSGC